MEEQPTPRDQPELNELEQMGMYYAKKLTLVAQGRASEMHGSTRNHLRKKKLIHQVPVDKITLGGGVLRLHVWELTDLGDRLLRQSLNLLEFSLWLGMEMEEDPDAEGT
jgi:hypothetical protein